MQGGVFPNKLCQTMDHSSRQTNLNSLSERTTESTASHTRVKPSKESREELTETRPELAVAQGPGQVESSSKGNTNPEAMSEKDTTLVTLTDELQRTRPEKLQAKSMQGSHGFSTDRGATTDTLRKGGQAS